MQYKITRNGQVSSCILTGELTFNDHDLYRMMLKESLEDGTNSIVLDLSGLEFIDSAGMGMLLVAQDQSQTANWKLAVVGPKGQVQKMLELAKLSHVMDIS